MRRAFSLLIGSFVLILAFGLAVNASLPQVTTGMWQSAGNLSAARMSAASAVMYDGRVLLTGGAASDGTVLASAEIFNSDGTFVTVAPMHMPRRGHAAVWLMDGYVLVTGGTTTGGGSLNSAEMYDPLTDTWTLLPASMVDARVGHTATQLPDGNVLLAGGENSSGALASTEIFSLTAETFSFAGNMATGRTAHAAAALHDGRVLIAGGTNANGGTLASTDIYDPDTGSILPGPSLSTPRAGASATTLLDGTVLIAGGRYPEGVTPPSTIAELNTAEIYVPVTGTITAVTSQLTYPRAGHEAFLLPNNNNVLIVGGTCGGVDLEKAELYTPWTGQFTQTGSMATPRSGAVGGALSPLADGLLLIAGGTNAGAAQVSGELYGFATIKTDKADYQPGEVVTITGSGWQPGESVTLHLEESPFVDAPPDMNAVADASGNIANTSFVPDELDQGVRFYLTATGNMSGAQAQNTFRDATSATVTVLGSQTPNPVPAGSSATYGADASTSVQVHGNGAGGCTFTPNVTGLPAGATASFNPATLSLKNRTDAFTLLTISTSGSTPAGSTTITVGGTGCSGTTTATATLVVSSSSSAPTITTQPSNQTVTYGSDATFTAAGDGTPAPTVQWQVSINGGTSWSDIGGATSTTLTLNSPPVSSSGNQYRAVFTNTGGSATSNPATLTVNKADQTITFTGAPASATYNTTFSVTAAASSGLTVTLGASGACSIAGTTVTMTSGSGTCSLTADQVGDGNYNAASQATQSTTAQKASQTITVTTHAPASAAYNSSFTVAATSSSGLGVAYSSSGSCSNTGATYTITSGSGTCIVNYDQAGDSNYNAATTVSESTTVGKLDQSITFTGAPASAAYNSTFTVTATASSGLSVTLGASGACSIAGTTVTMTSGSGTCSLTADQAGDANYNAAPQATQSTAAQKASQTITVSTHAPASAAYSSNFTVAATSSSGLAVTYSSSGSCSNTGATYTMTSGTGTCTVNFDQTGDSNYNAATQVVESTSAAKADQAALSVTGMPGTAQAYGTTFTVSTSGGSGLGAVTFASSGACSVNIDSGLVTMTSGSGTCSVTATKAADADYTSTTSAAATVAASKAIVTVVLNSSPNPSNVGQAVTITARVTVNSPGAGTPMGTITFSDYTIHGSTTLGAGTLDGSGNATLTTSALLAGGRWIVASYSGDSNFQSATAEMISQQVNLLTPTITWVNPVDIVYGTALSGTQLNAGASYSGSPISGTFAYTPAAGTVLGAGIQTLSVTFTPTDTATYRSANSSVTINVLKATPTITWPNPADIAQGTPLSSTQLNASSGGVAGTFTYTPPAGTVLALGNGQTLSTLFTPTDTANYNTASASVTINVVAKTVPTITWANPADITYGTALSATQLNATASVDGTFAYSPAAGTVLNAGAGQTLSVLFTPADTVNYTTATKSVTINVNKIVPTITWPTPADIVYGTTLSGAQLNATASVPGSFAYSPDAGVVLNAGNGQTLSVNFTPTDSNYASASATTAINVLRASQTISFGGLADRTYDDAPFTVSASATSALPVSFTASGNCSVAVSIVTITGAGSCTIMASQAGNGNYNAAAPVSQTFAIGKANQTITFPALGNKVASDPPFTVSASASSGLAVSFSTAGNCINSDNLVAITSTGSCTVTASQPGNVNYNAAASVARTFDITQAATTPAATPTFSPMPGTYNAPPTVSLMTATVGASIYFTTDGSTPTTSSALYTGPFVLSSTSRVRAIASGGGFGPSPVASTLYTVQAAAPRFSPAPGTYSTAQTVTLSSTSPGATIYYTTDGSMPTTASAVYAAPITVSASTTIRAIAGGGGYTSSSAITGSYNIAPVMPAFTPLPWTYTAQQTVTLTSSPGATIYYTMDGSNPTTASTPYTGPISVFRTTTIKAIAVGSAPLYASSSIAIGVYKIVAATPTFSPAGGAYNTAKSLTLSDVTPGVTIYYTTDGSTPTTASTPYVGPITVATTTTIRAIAQGGNYDASAVGSATYRIVAAAPTFSPPTGTYRGSASVTLSTISTGATIYYTTDGSTPTTAAAVYTGPITISATAMVKAIAAGGGYAPSSVASATYTIVP
ncbi:MAG: chitobiase/beta-hexosaminidase C-terminal domain-containing protein [Terriglobales bacterium]